MAKIIRLTESDLARIVRRVIKEDFDYNETINEFNEILFTLIELADKGNFVLRVVDEGRGINDTYGDTGEFETPRGFKKELYVRINHPTNMVIAPRGTDSHFSRDVVTSLLQRFEHRFPEMNFSTPYGNYIQIRPQKYVKQGLYGEYK
jgi:hypothetical protein